jgi:hypothetical protein
VAAFVACRVAPTDGRAASIRPIVRNFLPLGQELLPNDHLRRMNIKSVRDLKLALLILWAIFVLRPAGANDHF